LNFPKSLPSLATGLAHKESLGARIQVLQLAWFPFPPTIVEEAFVLLLDLVHQAQIKGRYPKPGFFEIRFHCFNENSIFQGTGLRSLNSRIFSAGLVYLCRSCAVQSCQFPLNRRNWRDGARTLLRDSLKEKAAFLAQRLHLSCKLAARAEHPTPWEARERSGSLAVRAGVAGSAQTRLRLSGTGRRVPAPPGPRGCSGSEERGCFHRSRLSPAVGDASAPCPGKGQLRPAMPRQAVAPTSDLPDENPIYCGPVAEESPQLRAQACAATALVCVRARERFCNHPFLFNCNAPAPLTVPDALVVPSSGL